MNGRIHALDGLRALAAAAVVLHHLGGEGAGRALAGWSLPVLGRFVEGLGASGVELFFVLSAVVLARPYVREAKRLSLPTYARRRAERLYPAYLCSWALSSLAIYLIASRPTWWTESSYLAQFDVATCLKQAGLLYFGYPAYNMAWWSLCTEVLFYFALPALIPLMRALPTRAWAALSVLSVAALASLVLPAHVARAPQAVAALASYAPCFAGGLVLARMVLPRRVALSLLGAGAAALVLTYATNTVPAQVGYGLFYTGLVSRTLDPACPLHRRLGTWELVWLGERSYSLFLVHGGILFLVFHGASLVMDPGAPFVLASRGVSLVLSLIAAMLVFTFVERHFARGLVTAEQFLPLRPAAGLARETSQGNLAGGQSPAACQATAIRARSR